MSEISENAIRVRKQRKITLQLEARPTSHLSEKQSKMTSIDQHNNVYSNRNELSKTTENTDLNQIVGARKRSILYDQTIKDTVQKYRQRVY